MPNQLTKIYHTLPRSIQTLGVNLYELKEWTARHSDGFESWLNLLKKTEQWNLEDLSKYQDAHLRKMVKYAYRYVPFYHQLYRKSNIDVSRIRTTDDLDKLPLIRKEDLFNHWSLFIPKTRVRFTTRSTSGTTGKPLRIRLSPSQVLLGKASAYTRDLWAGCASEWTARFVGDKPVRDHRDKQLFRKSYVMKRAIFPSYCISSGTLPYIFKSLGKLKIKFIQAYPSTAFLLAKSLQIQDQYMPMRAILYSSEPMYDFQRELIEDRFRARAFGFYGQAEEVISASECEKGEYHLQMITGVLEIVKNGLRISQGEKGFTVATSLHNYAMPLIRYELNDYTGYKEEECTCGRRLPLIHSVETKMEGFIVTPSGKIVSPSSLTFPFKEARNIIESQIVQKTVDSLLVRIVPTASYTDADGLAIAESLREFLGAEMSARIECVKQIHQLNAYKKSFVINELGPNYLEEALNE